jgi:UDP-N-acetylbacillosamine N-acetyltransferase
VTSKQKLVVWGASGHALVVADIIRLAGQYEIVAFFDDKRVAPKDGEFLGLPLLTDIGQLKELKKQGVESIILAVGNCSARLKLAQFALANGFKLATAIHPKALIARDVSIGMGSVIVGGAVINPGSLIGENAIINTGATIDHECIIDDGAHVGPGVHIGGRAKIGRAAWIGIGATVKDRVSIGANSIIGAGAVVLNDVPENTVAFGVPARAIRNVKLNEN